MPAIRVLRGATTPRYTHLDSGFLEVKQRDGKFAVLKFLGFICDRGRSAVFGAYGKISAICVCAHNGMDNGGWVDVGRDRYVLGWRALEFDTPPKTVGVYVLVDNYGMPIITEEPGFVTPKVYIKAPVVRLGDRSVG